MHGLTIYILYRKTAGYLEISESRETSGQERRGQGDIENREVPAQVYTSQETIGKFGFSPIGAAPATSTTGCTIHDLIPCKNRSLLVMFVL